MAHLRGSRHMLMALSAVITLFAVIRSVSEYGRSHPGFFVDPGGIVSNFGISPDASTQLGLSFPDRVLSVDGTRLEWGPTAPPAQAFDRAVQTAAAEGRSHVALTAKVGGRVVERHAKLEPFDGSRWWAIAGAVIFAGALYLVAGFVAFVLSPASPLARTFGKAAIATGLMLVTIFEHHTTRALAPVFLVASAFLPFSWLALALRLPDDAPVLERLPWLERVFDAVGAAFAVAYLVGYYGGLGIEPVQVAWSNLLRVSFLCFGATFLSRLFLAKEIRRRRLRALFVSVVPPHLVVIGLLTVPAWTARIFGSAAAIVSYGALSLFPIAIAYALVRYDLWGSRALLSRLLSRLAVGAVVLGVAIGLSTAAAVEFGVPFRHALGATTVSATLASVLVVLALSALDRWIFSARGSYKPTVEQLGEELISITSPDDVASAVERTVLRWLPCDDVRVTIAPTASDAATESGVRPNSSRAPDGRSGTAAPFQLDLHFGGQRLGSLHVGRKRDEALYTEDDLDLLRTIVNQGSIALAHAFAYQELETRRKEQAAAWRGERAALVETVAAEVAHEIRYPINFFKSFFKMRPDEPIDPEDMDIGREEVERLERLVAGLRKMAARTLDRAAIPLDDVIGRVEILLRDALGDRTIARRGLGGVVISGDADQLTQILVNLLSNGLQATGPEGRVGVDFTHGAEPSIVVWDDGPGFESETKDLFAPWYTTKEKGTGLGLAITHRLVRAHGWQIAAQRADGRTEFVISVSPDDVETRSSDLEYPLGSEQSEDSRRRRSA